MFVLLVPALCFAQEAVPSRPEDRPVPTPEVAMEHLILPEGYEVNCFASEQDFPELANPIAMTFDGGGRLWVAVTPTYPHLEPGESPEDKLLILEDTDQDGKADTMTVFAEGLYLPTGFVLTQDGVYVVSQPNLLHLRDTDGDLVADEEEIVLHGFGSEDSHHSMSAFTWGPDGAMYFNEGTFHNTQIETPHGPRRLRSGGVIRYKPDTEEVDIVVSFPFANPWGHTIDGWGQSVISDASNGNNYCLSHLMGAHTYPDNIKGQGPFRNVRSFTPGGRRPASGSEFITSRHLPDDVQGRFVTSQCIGFHGLRWYDLREEGSGFRTEAQPMELLQSTDTACRPVGMQVGPDGALYVLDWANPIVGHMQFNVRDERRDHEHGRVWRITYPQRPLSEPPVIEGASTAALLDHLKAYENRTRYFARRALQEGDRDEVLTAVNGWVAQLDPNDPQLDHHLLEALWIHQGHNHVDEVLLERVLTAEDEHARQSGLRVLRWWLDEVDDPFPMLERGVLDSSERVRLEAVLALGQMHDVRAAELAGLATSQSMDQDFEVAFNRTLAALSPYGTPTGEGTAAWRLQQVSDSALLAEPMDHFVAHERVRRPGLNHADRQAAIDWMAARTKRTVTGSLLQEAGRMNGQQDALDDVVAMLLNREQDDLASERAMLLEIARDPATAELLREAAWAAIMVGDGTATRAIDDANTSGDAGRANESLLRSVARLSHRSDVDSVREEVWDRSVALLPEIQSAGERPEGRFVRVSIPGKGTITLAEVEVYSGGVNVAKGKHARQSTTGFGGTPDKALDGNRDGVYSAGTSMHTQVGQLSPFWEVDLGQTLPMDTITIYGRTEPPYDQRLSGWTLELLDAARDPVWSATDLPTPQYSSTYGPGRTWDRRRVAAAMSALATTPDRGQEAMDLLLPFAASDADPSLQLTAIEAMQPIPESNWTEADGRWRIRDIDINTIADRMIYDVKRFEVPTGVPVRIRLTNRDSMPHNLLVCKPGSMRRVGIAADNMGTGPDAVSLNYIPDMKEIMHILAMVESGQSKEVLFVSPTRPGRYPYVCTFPGHWPMMNGVMTVKRQR